MPDREEIRKAREDRRGSEDSGDAIRRFSKSKKKKEGGPLRVRNLIGGAILAAGLGIGVTKGISCACSDEPVERTNPEDIMHIDDIPAPNTPGAARGEAAEATKVTSAVPETMIPGTIRAEIVDGRMTFTPIVPAGYAAEVTQNQLIGGGYHELTIRVFARTSTTVPIDTVRLKVHERGTEVPTFTFNTTTQ